MTKAESGILQGAPTPEAPTAEMYNAFGESISNMTPTELDQWAAANSELFSKIDMPKLQLFYAIKWMVQTGEQATDPRLEAMLTAAIASLARIGPAAATGLAWSSSQ